MGEERSFWRQRRVAALGSLLGASKEAACGQSRPEALGDLSASRIAISPDGRFVAALGPDQSVMLYPVEGGSPPRPVPGLSPGDVPIRFSGDGKALFVGRLAEIPGKVFRVDLATGRRELWKELAPSDRAGVARHFTIRMTPDGRSYAYHYVRYLNELYLVDGLK